MARKTYTADSKLGFMRVIVVINVALIILLTLTLLFVRGPSVQLDYHTFTFVAEILAMSAAVWLILKRKTYTRQIIIGAFVLVILTTEAPSLVTGQINAAEFIGNALPYLLIGTYFLTSRRAKAVLVQPWQTNHEELDENIKLWNPKKPEFWMRLIMYFFIFSIAGHWMEMGLQILIIHGLFPGTIATPDSLTWRDSVNPFFIYGASVAFCGLALHPLYLWLRTKLPKTWMALAVSFSVNTLFCVAAELALGLAFNADHSAWDYSDQFMNFQGQICLLYTMAFGILSSFITWILYPAMERRLSLIGHDTFRIAFVVLLVLFIFITAAYNFQSDYFFGPDAAVDASQL